MIPETNNVEKIVTYAEFKTATDIGLKALDGRMACVEGRLGTLETKFTDLVVRVSVIETKVAFAAGLGALVGGSVIGILNIAINVVLHH